MRTLEQQFDDAEALALRQFPDQPQERTAFHVEQLKRIARMLSFQVASLDEVMKWPGAGKYAEADK